MATKSKSFVGKKLTIPAGTRINRGGEVQRRDYDTRVTVIAEEKTRSGKTRVFWKSNGDRSTNAIIG